MCKQLICASQPAPLFTATVALLTSSGHATLTSSMAWPAAATIYWTEKRVDNSAYTPLEQILLRINQSDSHLQADFHTQAEFDTLGLFATPLVFCYTLGFFATPLVFVGTPLAFLLHPMIFAFYLCAAHP